jgi:Tfp pilus assembly PilM family ATPase
LLGHSAIGIDISDGALKAVLLHGSGGRLSVRRTWRLPIAEPDDAEARAEAVAELLRRAQPGAGTRLVLSAPAEESLTRTYRLPAVDAARADELVRYELLSELGVPDDDLVIRHIARRGAGEHPVLVYALRGRRLAAQQGALAARGLDVDDWELPGWALASFVEHELPGSRERLLLGVGQRSTDLVMLSASGLWARHLALGLQTADPAELARRLADECKAAAEALTPADQRFEPQQIVLAEDGACDAQLAGELKKLFSAPVVRVDGLRHIHASWRLSHEEQTAEQALSSARAFGLALAGLGVGHYACAAATGNPRRDALRLLPGVAAAVLVACATLLLLGEAARARAKELQSTLPISRLGDLQDRGRQRDALRAEIAAAESAADRLLDFAQRRSAVLAPRRALAAISDVAGDRDGQPLHVERVWVDAGAPGQRGLLQLTLQASKDFDATLGERLQRALRAEFADIGVRGPEPSAMAGLSKWTAEVALP